MTRVEGDQCVVLRDLGWAGYSTMLRLRGERYVPRMTYLDGTLWLMSPSFSHERLAERLGYFVMERLGVPEVWACDEDCLRILVLQADGRYVESETSLAFPFLTASEIFEWASRLQVVPETDWVKEVRRWVQETLVPRVRGGQAE